MLDYLNEYNIEYDKNLVDKKVNFIDKYILSGYGNYDKSIIETIKYSMRNYGIPMDTTYVGKAFCGMNDYIEDNKIRNKKILFIHTGGTPLFFDDLEVIDE